MKKIKFSKKLSLNKEVVVTLSGNQMNQVNGGILHDFYKWIIKHILTNQRNLMSVVGVVTCVLNGSVIKYRNC